MVGDAEKPKIGDRVKLRGSHRYAGFTGVYIRDAPFMGRKLPVVRIDSDGMKTMVIDPDNQMRKA